MATLQKIVKLTQSQYDTLKNGGTVKGETGLYDEWLYLVPDNGSGCGWQYIGDMYLHYNEMDAANVEISDYGLSKINNKILLVQIFLEDKGELVGSCITQKVNDTIPVHAPVYHPSMAGGGDLLFIILYGISSSDCFFTGSSLRQEITSIWMDYGITLKFYTMDKIDA